MALAIPKLRARMKLSQQGLANRLEMSQPHDNGRARGKFVNVTAKKSEGIR